MRVTLPVAFTLLLSFAAPLAYHYFEVRALRDHATHTATEIAAGLSRRAHQNPLLWRYDTPKLLADISAYRSEPGVVSVNVTDPSGVPVQLATDGTARAEVDVLRVSVPIALGAHTVGYVRVAVQASTVRRRSLAVLLLSSSLGLFVALLFLRLRRHETRILLSGQRASAAQERERRAIARDLHDSTGQALTAARINVELLRAHSPADLVDRSALLLDEAIDELRRAVERLGAAVLDQHPLHEALRHLADAFSERTGIECTLEVEPAAALSADVEAALYRIAQEALTNVTKHARASRVWLKFVASSRAVLLSIEDDGRGFDGKQRTAGYGLDGIRERAELLGGRVEIEHRANAGARLTVRIPRSVV